MRRPPRAFGPNHLEAIAAETRRLLGDEVRVAARSLSGPIPALRDVEKDAVSGAIEKRVREFSVGRALARQLLRELGHGDVSVPRRPDRSPEWPQSSWGSISHTDEVAVVAVGPEAMGFGIDVEGAEPLDAPLLRHILREDENEVLDSSEAGRVAKVVFSAKEAFYKAQHRYTGALLDFLDVRLVLDSEARRFQVEVHHPARTQLPGRFVGGWFETGPFVVTVAKLEGS